MSIEIKLIGRNGCHLCEIAQGDLAQVLARFANEHPDTEYVIEDLDIDQNPEYSHFTDEVPVLLLNGEQIAFWRIDQDRVFAKLEELA
ncbi:MAG: glutaredoxin family protein [Actinobacteria bacterium]|nr:glutaredoxin family protein [Actinomycetota bacterium]